MSVMLRSCTATARRARPAKTCWPASLGVLLIAGLAAGCGGQRALRQSLAQVAYRFNSDLRWGRHQSAANRMARPLADAYLTRTEAPDDPVRVSYVEVSRVVFDPKKRSAALHVRVHWHAVDLGILRKTILIEHWHVVGQAWVLRRVEHSAGPRFPWLADTKPPRSRPAPARVPARTAPRRPAETGRVPARTAPRRPAEAHEK